MIELIKNIGSYARKTKGEKDLLELWQKEDEDFDNIIIINVDEEKDEVTSELRDFTKEIFRKTLFYQDARLHVGTAVKIEGFKDVKQMAGKISDKIKSCTKFLELDKKYIEQIMQCITKEIDDDFSQSYIAVVLKNGCYAIELYYDKFEKAIENTKILNKQKKYSTCHLCGSEKANYSTILYTCYTNDKKIYSNTDGFTYCICKECLYDLLNGKRYVEQYLTTFWAGSNVMFLPHIFNDDIALNYEQYKIEGKRALLNISTNEAEVFDILSDNDESTATDIVFYYTQKKEWKMIYRIRDVLPSMFSKVSNNLKKYGSRDKNYSLSLNMVIDYLCVCDKKAKEYKRMLDMILHGKKLNRIQFFIRVMNKFKKGYFDDKNKKLDVSSKVHKYILRVHKIYNFLCECGCLDNGWHMFDINEGGNDYMKYKSIEEVFEKNVQFFNTDEKKAWFLMGRIYNSLIYYSKKYKASDEDELKKVTSHLEKNFFFNKKFDYKTFVYFANLCNEKLLKYGRNDAYFVKNMLTDAKSYMQMGSNKLDSNEAKYIFFWGMDQYINDNGEEK